MTYGEQLDGTLADAELKSGRTCESCEPVPGWSWGDAFGDACLDGLIYGPCTSDACQGVCEIRGRCRCACHGQTTESKDAHSTAGSGR